MRELDGTSFFQSNSDWETKPIMGLLSSHAKDMYGVLIITSAKTLGGDKEQLIEAADDSILKVQTSTHQKPYMSVEVDENGHLLLPNPDEWPKNGMEWKALIRSYVAVAYHKAGILNIGYCD